MSVSADPFNFVEPDFFVIGPYEWKGTLTYFRVMFDLVSNSGSLTLIPWIGRHGWWAVHSLIWSRGSTIVLEHSDYLDNDHRVERALTISHDLADRVCPPNNAAEFAQSLFVCCRHATMFQEISEISQGRIEQLISEDGGKGLADEFSKLGIAHPYPLDGKDYEYWDSSDSWRPLGEYEDSFDPSELKVFSRHQVIDKEPFASDLKPWWLNVQAPI